MHSQSLLSTKLSQLNLFTKQFNLQRENLMKFIIWNKIIDGKFFKIFNINLEILLNKNLSHDEYKKHFEILIDAIFTCEKFFRDIIDNSIIIIINIFFRDYTMFTHC